MSEELKDASIQLPKAMMWSILLNGVMGITMLITFCFCILDVDAFVNMVCCSEIVVSWHGVLMLL